MTAIELSGIRDVLIILYVVLMIPISIWKAAKDKPYKKKEGND